MDIIFHSCSSLEKVYYCEKFSKILLGGEMGLKKGVLRALKG